MGEDVDESNLIKHMLDSEEKWNRISKCLTDIIKTKEKEERRM